MIKKLPLVNASQAEAIFKVCELAGWKNYENVPVGKLLMLIICAPPLLIAAEKAHDIANDWIHDQLDGTSGLADALAELRPIKKIIDQAKGE